MDSKRFGLTISSSIHNTSQIDTLLSQFRTVGIISNDTGCSNILAQIANIAGIHHQIEMYLSGPAIEIFAGVGLQANNNDIEDVIKKSDLILTGTGWQTQSERNAIRIAMKYRKPCFVVLDHWQAFYSRFDPNIITDNFPNLLIVTNTLAYHKVQQEIPNIPCVQIDDLYLNSLIAKYENLFSSEPSQQSNYALYLSNGQPFDPKSPFDQMKQIERISELFTLPVFANHLDIRRLLFRPHPADNFLELDLPCKSFAIKVMSGDLLKNLVQAKVVVGADTHAMYIAMRLGIPTITILDTATRPDWLDFAPSVDELRSEPVLGKLFFDLMFDASGKTYLRQFSITDIDELHLSNLNDPLHMRFSRASISKTTFTDALFYSRQIREEGGFHLAIINRKHERVGSCTIDVDLSCKKIEVGILIYSRFSGKRFGSNVWQDLARKLRSLFPEFRIWAGTLNGNIAMRRVLENSGFVLTEKITQDYFLNGTEETVLIFEYSINSKSYH